MKLSIKVFERSVMKEAGGYVSNTDATDWIDNEGFFQYTQFTRSVPAPEGMTAAEWKRRILSAIENVDRRYSFGRICWDWVDDVIDAACDCGGEK